MAENSKSKKDVPYDGTDIHEVPMHQAGRFVELMDKSPQQRLRHLAKDTDAMTAVILNNAADRIDELEEGIIEELRRDAGIKRKLAN